MLKTLQRRTQRRRRAGELLADVIVQARAPVFYGRWGVADTIDGRFDLLVLHAWLVLDRLGAAGDKDLAQAVVDALFIHFDEALREQGAGDIGIGHRINKMADAFYGRLHAYREAPDVEGLAEAIRRNLYRGDESRLEEARGLAIYADRARRSLALTDLAAGSPDFGGLPA